MQSDVQVSFRGLPVSDDVQATCWSEAEKLERYYGRITACRVVIEEPHRRHRRGNHYGVRIDLVVPGAELVVNRAPSVRQKDETLPLALHEAFRAARRRLQDHARRVSGKVKVHERPLSNVA